MNKIPCEMIRDLFPSYIDGLTSETSNQLIREHLADCRNCTEVLTSMKRSGSLQEADPEEVKEIDYLKKNRTRNRRIVLGSICGALILIAAVLLARAFVIGNRHFNDWAALNLQAEGNTLAFDAVAMDSASAIAGVSFSEENGVITMLAKSVVVNPFCHGSRHVEYSAREEIREVRIGDRIVWSDGATVSALASDLFATRHEYIGDMPANQRTANALSLGAYLGTWQNELETAKEPYGWKIILSDDIPAEKQELKERDMAAFGRILIGLIGNLDHVTFVYRINGQKLTHAVTAKEATEYLGEEIKNCGKNIRALDRLIEKSGLYLYSFSEQAASLKNEVGIQIVNQTDIELHSFEFSCYKDGELCSSGGGINADGTAMGLGNSLILHLGPMEFGGSWNEASLLELSVTLLSTDGRKIEVPERIRIAPETGSVSKFRLTGTQADGYKIEQ